MASTNDERPVAIITGASQGIGAGLVDGYRRRGYRVVANSRTIKPSQSPDVVAVAGDVANPKTAERVVEDALARFGRIDTLINNAGAFIPKPFVHYSYDDFSKMLGINLGGFFYLSQRVAGHMLERGRGHIVSITTALVEQPLSAVPSALASLTKGGLNAATRALAIEYAAKGIRVNAVSAGIIKTPMHPAETHPFFAGLHPMQRMGTIEEIVEAVLYLETAAFVTGEILHVDGGQTAGH